MGVKNVARNDKSYNTEKNYANYNEALKKFYESHIGECYADDSTGLYGQSALYIASLFLNER